MKKNKIFWITILLLFFLMILFPDLTKADIRIKKIRHTDETTAVMGKPQPAKDEKGITWLTKDKMREDMGETSNIVRFDLKKIYINIDHSKKTYSEIDLPVELEKYISPEGKHFMQMTEMTSSITDTGETQKIKDWNCKKYLIEITASMMGMNWPINIEIWACKDIKIDLKAYHKFYGAILSTNPFTKDLSEKFKKIEGFPVVTVFSMKMSGTETRYREEVISVEKKDARAGTYDPPKDYKKIPFNPFGQDSLE